MTHLRRYGFTTVCTVLGLGLFSPLLAQLPVFQQGQPAAAPVQH